MKISMRNLLGSLMLLAAGFSLAQNTSIIHGTVVDENGGSLPGVVMSIESPALQGSRSATSRENGEFLFKLLPPGFYTMTVTMPGMQTVKQTVNLGLGQTSKPKIVMQPASTAEELIVIASVDPVLDTTDVVTNFQADFIDKLASGRGVRARTALAPGVTQGGVNGSVAISGAQTFENLFLLDGAVDTFDNIRGTPSGVVIPDAIQETTIMTASVNAEFGQFTGGVVNTITKSGGNNFSGTFRASVTNDDWVARDPLELASDTTQADEINETLSLTIGGPIIKDRLWFFASASRFKSDADGQLVAASPLSDAQATALGFPTGQTAPGVRTIPSSTEVERINLKLTAKLFEGHDLIVSWRDRTSDVTNNTGRGPIHQSGVKDQSVPQDSLSINYRGIITPEFSLDLLYTQKNASFAADSFDTSGDLRFTGTVLRDNNTRARFGSPQLASTDPEKRDNTTWHAKGSYFLTTSGAGSHDLSFGISEFKDERTANNSQSISDWEFWNVYTVWDDAGNVTPIFSNGQNGTNATGLIYWPIISPSLGSDFTTQSAFINDRWTFNEHWSFNIGLRYDKNDASAEDGKPVSSSDNTSPRFAVEYDLFGDGKHKFSASYAQYVARLNDAGQQASTAGSPSYVYWYYYGPVTTNIEDVFTDLENRFGAGTTVNPLDPANSAIITGSLANNLPDLSDPNNVRTLVDPDLQSPTSREFRIGYSTRFTKGYFKADYINREYGDFYTTNINQQLGRTNDGVNDLRELTNSVGDTYIRDYNSVQLTGAYYMSDNFQISGNYTWSQNTGNFIGETEGQAAVSASSVTFYPEYNNFANRNPAGYLNGDQRHIGRVFFIYDWNTSFGDFNFSATQRYESGTAYSANMNIPLRNVSDQYGLPVRGSLGYSSPPTSTTYFIGDRGGFRGESMTATNLGINYSVNFGRLEVFVEFNVFNVFNQDAAPYANNGWVNTTVNHTVTDAAGNAVVNPFNVFTDTPVEGVNYELGSSFGQPVEGFAFQTPRTLTFDIGFKF